MGAPLQKVETIFHHALELPAAERRAFLETACAGDTDLFEEVESLLRHRYGETGDLVAAVQPVASDLLGTAAVHDLAGGTAFGPYRVERKLGEGGMGTVYLATDSRLSRQVALKVIHSGVARAADARARFLREARSAAALSHPNIATLHDLGETGGTPWLVMEYVDGEPLRSRLGAPMDENTWLRYAREIAAALEHAHAHRIIHRDIKAENVLITEDDHVKIIDFGLARAVQGQQASSITAPNGFVGTLAYAAPEILAGGSASPRSDVYSAGVVLYEMACGEHPFAGPRAEALMAAILNGSYPTCGTRNPRLRPAIAALIGRAMEREPASRFRDGEELRAALQHVEDGGGFVPAKAAAPVLAVMDFAHIGGGADLDWLGSGIAETLSTDLARLKSVRVVSRSRVVQTRLRLGQPGNHADAALEMGRDLGARWIVTGAYQRMGEQIRVTATLVDAASGEAVAAEKVDGRWLDLFTVQDRVVAAVLKALTIRFSTSDEQKILPVETRDLAAYEHYVRGRQALNVMKGQSLADAIEQFERAVALDPDYALAYSGLGTSHALQFLRTSNPEDIMRAGRYLERAIELDPELGEPYPWLSNIRIRRNDPAGAFAAGRKGVELQPDLPDAHYFRGGGFYMVPEFQPGGVRHSPAYLAEAIRLQPRLHSAWFVLGASVAFLGKHAEAIRILAHAVRMESEPDVVYRFVGPRTVLGITHARAGEWDLARVWLLDALESLRGSEHVYATCFSTLSACALGEVDLRCGDEKSALAHFRQARRIIRESPRSTGSARLLIRIDSGLAAAYARTGETERARKLADETALQLEALTGQTATTTFECSLAQLWLILACAEVRLGSLDRAAGCLVRARELGWMDEAWLRRDPELRPLHGRSEFVSFVGELASAPDVEIPAVPIPASGQARA